MSFNNYDRAPFWLPEPQMSAFYEAYAALHELIIDESRWLEIRLEPGDALIFDNWRVLHGRRAYTGRRVFHGCYPRPRRHPQPTPGADLVSVICGEL